MWRFRVLDSCCNVGVTALFTLLTLLLVGQDAVAQDQPLSRNTAVIIRLDGAIMPFTKPYLERKLNEAKKDAVDIVILEIDSPGGELHTSLQIAQMLSDVDWAETVAYVPSSAMYGALSGAAFAALGCNRIIVGERAEIGDAGIIESDGNSPFRYAPEKLRTDVVAKIRDVAEAQGHPAALAEAMVDKDIDVYRVRNTRTDEETYMTEEDLADAEDAEDWEKGRPVKESLGANFFEVNGKRAAELGLAESNAESREELFEQLDVVGTPKVVKWATVDTVVLVLNHPLVTALLFIVGLVALYIEMSSPGIGMGILTAGLCFALFFWSRFLGGTADWLELVLFLAGLAFLGVELFVLPGFGIAGLTGMLLLGASLILAGQDFVIPETDADMATLTRSLSVLMGSVLTFFILAAFMNRYFGALPVLGHLTLRPPSDREGAADDVASDMAVAVGDTGRADSALRPAGRARFGRQMLDVMTDGDFVDAGTAIRITRISGRRVFVEKA